MEFGNKKSNTKQFLNQMNSIQKKENYRIAKGQFLKATDVPSLQEALIKILGLK